MTELKRPEIEFNKAGACYDLERMDSFLSECAEKLLEARKMREEAERSSDFNVDKRIILRKEASKLEDEVILCLRNAK